MKNYEAKEFLNINQTPCQECTTKAEISYEYNKDGKDMFAFYCKRCANDLGIEWRTMQELIGEIYKENNPTKRKRCFGICCCYCAPFEEADLS